jgi:hypothetical protein
LALLVEAAEGSAIKGKTAGELSGLDRERLERGYGYSVDEADKAVMLFERMKIPAGRESYFMQELSPVIMQAAANNRSSEGLRGDLAKRFSGRRDVAYTAPHGITKDGYKGNVFLPYISRAGYNNPQAGGDAGPVYMRNEWTYIPVKSTTSGNRYHGNGQIRGVIENGDRQTEGQGIGLVSHNGSGIPVSGGKAIAGQGIGTASHDGSGIPVSGGGPEQPYTAEAREGVKRQFPGRDAELERLRRIEANYEKDKAAMSREKAPALARSESHEVGHAEDGGEEFIEPEKASLKMSSKLLEELIKRSRI